MLRAEGGAAEEQAEGAQRAVVVRLGRGCEVGFVVAAGARAGAAVVEAPDAAVGQDAPADAPVRVDIRRRQVAQDLRVRRAALALLLFVARVQRHAEPFALGDGKGIGVSLRSRLGRGACLRLGIAEQQMVGNVLVAVAALLRQEVAPAEQIQQGADQLLLGRGLVDRVKAGRIVEQTERLRAEGLDLRGLRQGFLPGVGVENAFFEKVGGEELAGHWRWQMWRGSRRLPRLGDGLTGDTLRWADLSYGQIIRACEGYRLCRKSTIWRNARASQSHTPASAASPSRRPGS